MQYSKSRDLKPSRPRPAKMSVETPSLLKRLHHNKTWEPLTKKQQNMMSNCDVHRQETQVARHLVAVERSLKGWHTPRGLTRLDGARGKKQVWRTHWKQVFRKQMYCIEESTCDIFGTSRRPRSGSAPGELRSPCYASALTSDKVTSISIMTRFSISTAICHKFTRKFSP